MRDAAFLFELFVSEWADDCELVIAIANHAAWTRYKRCDSSNRDWNIFPFHRLWSDPQFWTNKYHVTDELSTSTK